MARTIDASRYDIPEKKPALKPADVGGEEELVLTVEFAQERTIPDGPRDRVAIMVQFTEYPDHYYWPGFRDTKMLLDKLGTDLDAWGKRPVPLVIVDRNNPRTHAPVSQLGVAPDWDDAIDRQLQREAEASAAQAKSPKKRG